jgi:glycosyltransferase involved in cell wall biosynthesis
MNHINVLQITDTLELGGLERVAVNVANCLPRNRYRSHLCSTRGDGPLDQTILPDVGRLRLARKGRWDVGALARLVGYIRANDVRILHPHGTSLFIAAVASLFPPWPVVVWHVHLGHHASEEQPGRLYRLAVRRLGGVIAVNEPLAAWARSRLELPADRVWYIPNFVCAPLADEPRPELPGTDGYRVVCVANLRPEKDHANLLRAMHDVVRYVPAAHLLLLGNGGDPVYTDQIKKAMTQDGLAGHVTWLGPRHDVSAVLKACDIGVLSSASEGMPLALLEYGMNGLAAVATQVGQCSEVLDHGHAGLVVLPSSSRSLSDAIISLLQSPEQRIRLGERLRQRTTLVYSAEVSMNQICGVYDRILTGRSPEAT